MFMFFSPQNKKCKMSSQRQSWETQGLSHKYVRLNQPEKAELSKVFPLEWLKKALTAILTTF